jgi:hypothetical protein
MGDGGTFVYVHGASDRRAGVEEHVRRIASSLEARGSGWRVDAAYWGDEAGPALDRVLTALPGGGETSAVPATRLRGRSRLVQAAAAVIIALQFVNVRAPTWLRVRATDVLLGKRAGLMREILGLADVLVYQRAGDAIREVVRARLQEAADHGGPVIALGNSLGGIVLVDLLRRPGAPRPDLLVTVGSQASVLQTFGGLGPDPAPPFQPWLNIYDRRDFFGFIAQPVWPDQPGIEDVAVDLGLGFPDVHGPAYFDHPAVFEAIFAHPALAPTAG